MTIVAPFRTTGLLLTIIVGVLFARETCADDDSSLAEAQALLKEAEAVRDVDDGFEAARLARKVQQVLLPALRLDTETVDAWWLYGAASQLEEDEYGMTRALVAIRELNPAFADDKALSRHMEIWKSVTTDQRITDYTTMRAESRKLLTAAKRGDAKSMALLAVHYDRGKGVVIDYEAAAAWYRKSADMGDPMGMGGFAALTANGTGVPQDDEAAIAWATKSAALGNGRAMALLGFFYEHERGGMEKDLGLALEWYQKAADAKSFFGYRRLAECYKNGVGVERNMKEAIAWYRKGAAEGDLVAASELALLLISRVLGDPTWVRIEEVPLDPTECGKWCRMAAESGARRDLYHAGVSYEYGFGPRDEVRAARLYRRSARLGLASAMREVGKHYKEGIGAPADHDLAIRWLRRAVESGDKVALIELGDMYRDGLGFPQLDKEALRCYHAAAEANWGGGFERVGWMYENGRGVAQDYNEAIRWYENAVKAKLGGSGAYRLGMLHLNGNGVKKDPDAALRWFRKGAELKDPFSMCRLGLMYEEGTGVPKDEAEALNWYRKAAASFNGKAMYHLARCHELGLGGVPKNIEEAIKGYRVAARRNGDEAKAALRRLGVAESETEEEK